MFLGKRIEDITELEIRSLIENRISEKKTIEYKTTLPANDNDSKKEFLADVSSFANASGGVILFGIREESGFPTHICSLNSNPDAEKQRLENLLRTCISPRIPGIEMVTLPISSSGFIIILDIPKSWSSPHAVIFQSHWRFYSRNSAGKYPLDVAELKAAFLFSESISNNLRNFRMDRLEKIVSGNTPVPLIERNGRLVLHMIPVEAFNGNTYDLHSLDSKILSPINSLGCNFRYNFDGRLSYSPDPGTTSSISYLQVFRNGIIEAVECRLIRQHEERGKYIPGEYYEVKVMQALPNFLQIEKSLGVNTPIILMLSLLDVLGFRMGVDQFLYFSDGELIDRQNLIIPEVVIEDMNEKPATIMRSSFDYIWNAAGWKESLNYDAKGEWVGMRR